jgi:hypothetical protein
MVRPLLFAAAALAATPVAAHAAPVRAPAPVAGKNEQLVGLVWQYLILPVIVAAVLALISGGDDEEPASP